MDCLHGYQPSSRVARVGCPPCSTAAHAFRRPPSSCPGRIVVCYGVHTRRLKGPVLSIALHRVLSG